LLQVIHADLTQKIAGQNLLQPDTQTISEAVNSFRHLWLKFLGMETGTHKSEPKAIYLVNCRMWYLAKVEVHCFPSYIQAFASFLLIHPFPESQRKAYGLTCP